MKWIIHETYNEISNTYSLDTSSHGELLAFIRDKMANEEYKFRVDYEEFIDVRSNKRKIVAVLLRF